MKILITGATGLIGSELVSLLLQNGVSIHYLARSKKEVKNEPNYQGFLWNPEQGKIDENCLLGVDAIIHLAGAPISMRWTQKNKQEIIESRILSTNLLYRTLKSHPNQVKQLVSASAIGIYPDSLENVYTEDNKSIDDSFLGQVVLKWEQAADQFKRLDIKVCKIRTGLVLAKKGGMLKELLKPIKLGAGSAYGSGKQWQSWIHIDDLTHLYYFALQNNWEGVYNATAPNPVDNEELTKTIAQVLEKPYFLPNIPEFLLKLILGEMHILLISSQNVNSQKAQDNGFVFKYRTLEKAIKALLQK
ncbi:TIGR01777 family oxidoreductase [uncultured Flavobacterium sp.]|uniref:TIGR01777 family oxidoreductase n=1 Tax=uncultured Flavobacterium sp. TaxID=165435 RepID=UPI0025F93893|nr:TIGR01777 family oxidoreductase [uncultured Flavobacterium sp.]